MTRTQKQPPKSSAVGESHKAAVVFETPVRSKRRTVNLSQAVWDLVYAESKKESPEEPLDISHMSRILIREAVNARRLKRGEKPISSDDHQFS